MTRKGIYRFFRRRLRLFRKLKLARYSLAFFRFARDTGSRFRRLQYAPNTLARVYHVEPRPHAIRDFLIWLHREAEEVGKLPCPNKTLDVAVVLPPNSTERSTDLLAAFALCSLAGDIHFFSSPEEFQDYLPFFVPAEQHDGLRVQSLSPTRLSFEAIRSLESRPNLHLEPLKDRKAFSNGFIKSLGLTRQVVALHVVPSISLASEEWVGLFRDVLWQHCEVSFLLLDACEVIPTRSLQRLPNVINLCSLGMGLLDQFAIAHAADAYAGTFGHYALAVIGSEHPFGIFDFPHGASLDSLKLASVSPERDGTNLTHWFVKDSLSPSTLRLFLDEVLHSRGSETAPSTLAGDSVHGRLQSTPK
jgi:hypothetical protein